MMVTYLVLVYLIGIPIFFVTTHQYRRETNENDLIVALVWPLAVALFVTRLS